MECQLSKYLTDYMILRFALEWNQQRGDPTDGGNAPRNLIPRLHETRICVSRLHMPDINLFEQDHRTIKLCSGPMLGLKRFRCASITIAGIELTHRIKKGPFNLGKLRIETKRRP